MNGNDMLEYEEGNVETLFESFSKKYAKEWEMFKNSTEEYFIEKYKEKWAEHVQEEYDNSKVEQAELIKE